MHGFGILVYPVGVETTPVPERVFPITLGDTRDAVGYVEGYTLSTFGAV